MNQTARISLQKQQCQRARRQKTNRSAITHGATARPCLQIFPQTNRISGPPRPDPASLRLGEAVSRPTTQNLQGLSWGSVDLFCSMYQQLSSEPAGKAPFLRPERQNLHK